jgi:hypothetical protein
VRADERAGRLSDPRDLYYLAAEIVNAASAEPNRRRRLVWLDKARDYLKASLVAQDAPQWGGKGWTPLPPELLNALPRDLIALFHAASGVA